MRISTIFVFETMGFKWNLFEGSFFTMIHELFLNPHKILDLLMSHMIFYKDKIFTSQTRRAIFHIFFIKKKIFAYTAQNAGKMHFLTYFSKSFANSKKYGPWHLSPILSESLYPNLHLLSFTLCEYVLHTVLYIYMKKPT